MSPRHLLIALLCFVSLFAGLYAAAFGANREFAFAGKSRRKNARTSGLF